MRWKQVVIGDKMLEAARFSGDSIAYLNVSGTNREVIVSGDQKELFTKMQEIFNEHGMDIYPKMDSILIARQIESSLRYEFTDSTTLKLKGMIKIDSVFITAKRKPLNIKNFRLMKRPFHWITESAYLH